jgi:hypothetical protein
MCFYIANARFASGVDGLPDFAHPEGPLIRILTPVPFESLAVAEAALRALLVDLEDRIDNVEANPGEAAGARETMAVWGEFPIVLWNSHEPDRHVVYDNLFNSSDPSVAEAANHFVTPEFNRLADERRALDLEDSEDDLDPVPASRFTVRSLPEWDRIDILSKYVATIAVEHFIEHPEDSLYIDPLTGVSAVESLDAEVLAELQGEIQAEADARVLPSRRGDPSSLRVRGE